MLLIAMLEVISTITVLILCKTKVMLTMGVTDTYGKVMKEMTKAMMTLTNDVRLVFL